MTGHLAASVILTSRASPKITFEETRTLPRSDNAVPFVETNRAS